MNIAIAMIMHPTQDAVLIAQRRPDVPLANFWEFPGGKCLPGESLKESVIRETWEEIGLKVTVIEDWPSQTSAFPGLTVTLFPFLCRAETTEPRPVGNRQTAWVSPEDLDDYPFPDPHTPLIERLRMRRSLIRPVLKQNLTR